MAPAPKKAVKAVAKPVAKKTATKATTGKSSLVTRNGTAPGSREKAIIKAEENAKYWANPYQQGGKPSMVNAVKDVFNKGPYSKAKKELDAVRKSAGWGSANFGTGAERSISKKPKKK